MGHDVERQLEVMGGLLAQMRELADARFHLLPGHFQDSFVTGLANLAGQVQRQNELLASVTRAALIAQTTKGPRISEDDVPLHWSPIGGIPVWSIASRATLDRANLARSESSSASPPADAEVVIYLDEYSDEQLEEIQSTALRLAKDLGYDDFSLTDEHIDSIFRRFRGKLKDGLQSDFVARRMEEVEERVSVETIGRVRAETDAIKTSNAVNLIASLADVPNAVVRVGGVLIIKQTDDSSNPIALVRELTGKEIRALEMNPGIQKEPQSALEALALAVAAMDDDDISDENASAET